MVSFHYEIVGLRHKKLPLRWELSDASSNDLVASENSAYTIVPANEMTTAGDWSAGGPGSPRRVTPTTPAVTIYQPQGPPYGLKHSSTRRNFRVTRTLSLITRARE